MDDLGSSCKKKMHCGWRDWSGLPRNVLFDIMDRLTIIDDYVRFGTVCVSWRTVFTHEDPKNKNKHCSQPFLLVASPDVNKRRMCLYSLSREMIYKFNTHLPDSIMFCCGSSFGWFVRMEEDHNKYNEYIIHLQNPFLHSRNIDLPGLDDVKKLLPEFGPFSGLQLWKTALSADPSSSDEFAVVAIMSKFSGLAVFESGKKHWTSIGEWLNDWRREGTFQDVIFAQNAKQFYALRNNTEVLAIDLQGREPKLVQVMPPTNLTADDVGVVLKKYIVEDLSSVDLLQVHKYLNYTSKAHYFVVFKLNSVEGRWIRIHNLGERIMFLGNNNSVVRSASDCPGCKPNCIYYTEDVSRCFTGKRSYGPQRDGIYSLGENTVFPHYSTLPSDKILPPCMWVDPTLVYAR